MSELKSLSIAMTRTIFSLETKSPVTKIIGNKQPKELIQKLRIRAHEKDPHGTPRSSSKTSRSTIKKAEEITTTFISVEALEKFTKT
jgi:hypothetical protein